MNQSVSDSVATAQSLPTCPKCAGPAKCFRRDIGGVNYEDEYTLECPVCGTVGRQTEYGGSFSSDDSVTTCPFCRKPYFVHDVPTGTNTNPKEA